MFIVLHGLINLLLNLTYFDARSEEENHGSQQRHCRVCEIQSDILSRLPMKKLVSFKTVCKSWSAQLIGNPYHLDLHAKFPTGSKQPMLFSGYQEIVGIGSPSIPSTQLPSTVLPAEREL